MKWEFELLEGGSCVKVTEEGVFSPEDHHEMTKDLLSRDFWTPGMNILFDCTKLDFSDSRSRDVSETADNFVHHDLLIGCGKIAIFVKSVGDFERGRQFEMLTDEKLCADISVFLNENQALRWLGV